jgi:RNA polymerase sigma factor (sigma-70 family)
MTSADPPEPMLPQLTNWLWLNLSFFESPADFVIHSMRGSGIELTADVQSAIVLVLVRNLQSRRASRVMAKMYNAAQTAIPRSAGNSLEQLWCAYAERVTKIYCTEHERVEKLTSNCSSEWERLQTQLFHCACRMLQQKGLRSSYARDKAEDVAQQACERIYVSFFPYDVVFDQWANTILKNLINYTLYRSQDILDRQPHIVSIDDLEMPEDVIRAKPALQPTRPDPTQQLETHERLHALFEALENMQSQNRQAVVVYTYLVGMPDEEIADMLGRRKSAVQTLRHRALQQLRRWFVEKSG